MDYLEDFELFPSPNVDQSRINILSPNLVSSRILLSCIEEAASHQESLKTTLL
jgi:hypothetical protein